MPANGHLIRQLSNALSGGSTFWYHKEILLVGSESRLSTKQEKLSLNQPAYPVEQFIKRLCIYFVKGTSCGTRFMYCL